MSFDHEKLNVYQKSLDFIEWLHSNLDSTIKVGNVYNQLDRASTSIPLNIAEGNGKYTSKDRCRYFDIARGPALECAACIDVLFRKKFLSEELVRYGKGQLKVIVSMLIGLIKSNSDRVHEANIEYGSD